MFHASPSKILIRRWKLITLAGLVVALVVGVGTLIFPLEYRADAQVLIISHSRYGVDPYTLVKSAERIGENLSQVVGTNDFYAKVVSVPQYTLDLDRFRGVSERTKRKRWQKSVSASVVFGTGVLSVSTYHTDSAQARQFAGAVAETLVTQGAEYVGGNVTIKVVNPPVVTSIPVRPNLLVNVVLGFIVGGLIMSLLSIRKARQHLLNS